MICPNCKREIDENSNFCSYCGAKLGSCSACGEPLGATDNYCTHCGKEVRKTKTESDGGYYVPLTPRVSPRRESPSKLYETQEPTNIEDYQREELDTPKKKVNTKIIVFSVIALVLATVVSYQYLMYDSTPFYTESDIPEKAQDITVGGQTSLSSYTANNVQEGKSCLYNDFIFMTDDSGYLVKMKRNLEDKEVLLNEEVSYINVVDDIIYYANSKNYLCSMDINGKDNKVILKDSVYYLIAVDNKLYYQLDSDNESIHVYDLKTEKSTKLNDKASYCINVAEDKIYYLSDQDIYQMNLDGSEDTKLISGKYYGVVYQKGFLYALDSTGVIQYDIKNNKKETLIEKGYKFNLTEEYIFVYTVKGDLIRYSLSTKEEKEIYQGRIERIDVLGDKLILDVVTGDNFQIIINFDGTSMGRLFPESDGTFV